MKNNFTSNCLSVYLNRRSTGISISISSDYSGSCRKSPLHVNEKRLAEEIEHYWKSIKTKKMLSMSVGFGEIDWYDNLTNIYTTPFVTIERGLRKAKIREHDHGSIPKEWSFEFNAFISDTTTINPILEIVKGAIGSYLTPELEKSFVKQTRLLLQKKTSHVSFEIS